MEAFRFKMCSTFFIANKIIFNLILSLSLFVEAANCDWQSIRTRRIELQSLRLLSYDWAGRELIKSVEFA